MSLMSLIRWIVVLVIGWTIVAIGIGASGTRLLDREPAISAGAGSPAVEAMPTSLVESNGFVLVDRTSGRWTTMRVPDGERWSNLGVAPWLGPDGDIEVVGRWVNTDRDDFGGWALFRLSDGAVLDRLPTEMLASGRPCCVPARPRTIVFAAGDGRLYRCHLGPEGAETAAGAAPRRVYASGRVEPSDPITWEVRPPGEGEPMIQDPLWPTEPALRRWVFVSLVTKEKHDDGLAYGPARLWWLELSDDARTIVAAGPLTRPTTDADRSLIVERFPNVAIGSDSTVRLIYEERRLRAPTGRIVAAEIEFDARTGRPRASGVAPRCLLPSARPIEAAPLLISTDGSAIFGYDLSGQLAAFTARWQP